MPLTFYTEEDLSQRVEEAVAVAVTRNMIMLKARLTKIEPDVSATAPEHVIGWKSGHADAITRACDAADDMIDMANPT